MKKHILSAVLLALSFAAFSQAPDSISYQAVIRNADGSLKIEETVAIQIIIRQTTEEGTSVYLENHNTRTNEMGLVSLIIGGGTSFSDFSAIDWSAGPYFLEVTVNGVEIGTSQLLSVPYALHSRTAETATSVLTETDPVFGSSVAGQITSTDTVNWNNKLDSYSETQDLSDVISINNAANGQIKNLTDPTEPQDAVTKAYVDALLARTQDLELLVMGFTDSRDGHRYKAVKIGDQVWMAENLKYLPAVAGISTVSETDPYYYVWGYDGTDVNQAMAYANYQTYGVLYNWPAAQTACPAGWHLPTDPEWTILENYLIASGYNYDGTTTFNKIAKALASSILWGASTNEGAIGNTDYPEKRNASGFSALPGGSRNASVGFSGLGYNGYWWSATESGTGNPWYRGLISNLNNVHRTTISKGYGFSVRCLRD
ncbi:MAG: hypothetical protein JXR52_10105 [Bacteroidales bacterium]|nr:hypothetical protein [Bacteroidales bacterium]